jgi:hypothetical protein
VSPAESVRGLCVSKLPAELRELEFLFVYALAEVGGSVVIAVSVLVRRGFNVGLRLSD